MKIRYITATTTLVLLCLLSGPLRAQGGHGDPGIVDKVEQQLRETDDVLQRARNAVRSSNNPIAEQTLVQAIRLQESAWESFAAGSYQTAMFLTRQARERAMSALTVGRQAQQYEGVLQRRLERAADMLDRVRDHLSELKDEPLNAIYENALTNLDRAWEFYRTGQHRPAVKLADQVEKAAEKLLSRRNAELRNRQQFRQRLENMERLLEQAEITTENCESEVAPRLMERAENTVRVAEELGRQDRYLAALQSLRQARQMVLQASRECEGPDQLIRRYERLKKHADELSELLSSGPGATDDPALKLVEQAREQLKIAREQLDQDRLEAASAPLQAAQLALRQAQKHLESR
ncbi:MAG TPA: hypothetical protein VMY05_05690 [Acidobacteriota bacterium]|nr:hypothetical protein [Acidobacteriota bacterium]